MWLTKIFAREFGFSDVQSNYSRVYAWMANQLGHMTLGLATALLFVWIVETVFAVGREWRSKGLPGAFCANCEAGGCAEHVFWSLAIIAVAIGFIAAGWMMKRNRFTFTAIGLFVAVGLWAMTTGCGECWNYVLMLTAIGVLALGFGAAVWSAGLKPLAIRPVETPMQKKWRRDLHDAVNMRAVALSERGCAALVVIVSILGILLMGETWSRIDGIPLDETKMPAGHPLTIFAVTTACALFAVACAILCKDPRFIPIAALILLAAFMVATEGAPLWFDDWTYAPQALASAFLLYSTVIIAMLAKEDERFTKVERIVQTFANLLIAGGVYIALREVKNDDWQLSVAAGMASLCMWWIKEFASDLPNVHREIASVVLKRHTADERDTLSEVDEATLTDKRRALEKEYFRDARVDARADGMFYFAGAWIGAGVLTDVPVMSERAWPAGSEIFGLLLFLAIFLGLGKNWAYRQLALDLMGARMASRFAVFRAELRLRSLFVSKSGHVQVGGLQGGDWLTHPLLKLRNFASPYNISADKPHPAIAEGEVADLDDAPIHERFDHVIVLGALGSGRSPLGRAIASEAALADWPTRFQIKRRAKVVADEDRRAARYITGARLLNYVNDVEYRSDLSATPTVPFSVDARTGRAVRGVREDCDVERAADVVIIDDVSMRDAQDGEWLAARFANLSLAQGQQTVWLIDIEDDRVTTSEALLMKAVAEVEMLLSQLAMATGGEAADDRCHVALALTRRFDDPYAEPSSSPT